MKITMDLRWPEVGDHGSVPTPPASPRYHASGRYGAYKSPYPIGEEDFIVSIRAGGAEAEKAILTALAQLDGFERHVMQTGDHGWLRSPQALGPGAGLAGAVNCVYGREIRAKSA